MELDVSIDYDWLAILSLVGNREIAL